MIWVLRFLLDLYIRFPSYLISRDVSFSELQELMICCWFLLGATPQYSAHNERLSFGINFKFIKACKLAAKAHGHTQSLETACFFS